MLNKFGISILAAIMAIVFSAFTMPKKAATVKTVDLYWYEVVNNQIPQGANPVIHDSKSEAEALEFCPEGSQRDCLRGFTSQLNTDNGPVTPNDMASADEIKTDEQP